MRLLRGVCMTVAVFAHHSEGFYQRVCPVQSVRFEDLLHRCTSFVFFALIVPVVYVSRYTCMATGYTCAAPLPHMRLNDNFAVHMTA